MTTVRYPFLDLSKVTEPYKDELKAAAARVIDSGRYIGGAENETFERELALHTGTGYAVGVSNGLDALRLIFKACIELGRLAPGDAVIVPANTYVASVLAITDCGLRPVFAEPDLTTLNLDTSRLEEVYTPDVKAVLTVHLYGRACYDSRLKDFAERHSLIVVEDNAQAIGAEAEGYGRTGSLGDAAAFSFYPTKNIGAIGDAGAVTTSDRQLAEAVRALANYGSDRRYHNIYRGYNCRLDPLQAAFLSIRLRHIDAETSHRRRIAAIYNEAITNPNIVKPSVGEPDLHVWHQYVVRTAGRDAFCRWLSDNGVGYDIHYAVPPHKQPCYAEYAMLSLPLTERLAGEVVSLPVSACTSENDAAEIASIINRFKQ